MSFGRHVVVVMVVSAAAVLLGSLAVADGLFGSLVEKVEVDRYQAIETALVDRLEEAQNKALARATMVAALPSVQALVAAQDRTGLQAELAELYQSAHDRGGVAQAQFHVPPATSLLRLHAPERFGDDLSKFRPMVVDVNQDHETRKGLSIAVAGPAIFGITPVHDAAGAHVGSFEIGLDVADALDALKARFEVDAAIWLDEKTLRDVATGAPPGSLSEDKRVGRFLRWHSTHDERTAGLVSDADLDGGAHRYVREVQGVAYGVALVPVTNYAGKPLGVAMVAADFSSSRGARLRTRVWLGLVGLVGSTVLAGIVSVGIRGFVLRPLGSVAATLKAVADGDRSKGLETDGLCAEFEPVAAEIERLRSRP
jgi:methyl-accepting chemotaxis protein